MAVIRLPLTQVTPNKRQKRIDYKNSFIKGGLPFDLLIIIIGDIIAWGVSRILSIM